VHGLVFATLREYSDVRLGRERAAEIWASENVDPNGAHPDELFTEMLERVRAAAGADAAKLERDFGSYTAQSAFVAMFPDYYAAQDGTVPFLLGVEEQIHEVVRSTVPGARPPHLRIQPLGGIGALVTYTSPRQLCRLLEGLVFGTAAYYGDDVVVDEIQCMRTGDAGCVFTILPREHALG